MTLAEQLFHYAESFLTGDAAFDAAIRLKIEHTRRVWQLTGEIAEHECFDAESVMLARTAGLLHDYGRFEQYRQFQTFHDVKSVDHAALGAELIRRHGLLRDGFSPRQRGIVLGAVRLHNVLALPELADPVFRRVAMAVRDADKLDIIPILLESLAAPDHATVVWELREEPRLSPGVAAALLAGETPRHADFRTAADFVTAKLGWVYDLNTGYARRCFRERGFLGKLCAFLPENEEISRIRTMAETALSCESARNAV